MDTKSLDTLIKIKKKSQASKADKKRFQDEWLAFVKEYGFNDAAENYLYDGFSFQGMVPYITYLEEINDKQRAINQLLSGKRFCKNKGITFKMMIHLLALLIIKFQNEKMLIAKIISWIPELSINKEKKRLSDITKSVDKYFVHVLNSDVMLPDFNTLNLRPAEVNSFRKMMSEAISDLLADGHSSPKELSVIAHIEKWLAVKSHQLVAAPVASPNIEGIHDKSSEKEIQKVISLVEANTREADENTFPIGKVYTWHDGLSITIEAIKRLEKEIVKLQLECGNISSENSRLNSEYAVLQTAFNNEREYNEQLQAEVTQLKGEILVFQQKITSLESILCERETEIAERIKMTDVLSRDRVKQSNEAIIRLSSKLKVEYRDFLDAEALQMDSELGENMRLQLKSVFDILKKNGIIFE